jgi:SAM-dependent methyltransferase
MAQPPADALALYDVTVERLRAALSGGLPPTVDLPGTLTAYAYWVCLGADKPGTTWDQVLQQYTDEALTYAAAGWESEQCETEALRRVLGRARGPVLDVGAGWGRLAPLYQAAGLQAVFLEPIILGVRLMRRQALGPAICARGERLPCAGGTFGTALIGWVLHHGADGTDPATILGEAARVCAPGGTLISIEPLSERFTQPEWLGLVAGAGFVVNELVQLAEVRHHRRGTEVHKLAVCTRRSD